MERSELLVGRTRAEVVGVLGEPDGKAGDILTYTVDLGHKFFGSDPWHYTLFVHFQQPGAIVDDVWHDD